MDTLSLKFETLYGDATYLQRYFCPGRVNLIGEHIDYLGGLVLPMAISMGITALVKATNEPIIRLHSTDFDETIEFDIDHLPESKQENWTDFVVGVLNHLRSEGVILSGVNILFDSDLPKSSGLSSSAALEVLCYLMFTELWTDSACNRIEMAIDCQRIENNFVGVNCGIMDQFAVANGKLGHALLLNCNSLENELIPLNLTGYQLLIINTNKPRQLAHSAYNQRRAECDEVLRILQYSNPSLPDLVSGDIASLFLIEDEILRKRARHAITENERVKKSVHALKNNDLMEFGQLLNESHASLRDDFEVSCNELDFIAAELQASEYCLGARMTGAGFGGCCIALVEADYAETVSKKLITTYENRFGFAPSVYPCNTSDGVHAITT